MVVVTEHFTYDAADHMTQIIYADGSVTKTEYNAIGKLSATVDSKDRRTTYEYDLFGNLSKITYCDNTTETFAYDAEGRNTAATDRMSRTVILSYDAVGNLKTITYPNGAKVSYTYDAKYRLTSVTSVNGGTSYAMNFAFVWMMATDQEMDYYSGANYEMWIDNSPTIGYTINIRVGDTLLSICGSPNDDAMKAHIQSMITDAFF